MGITEDMLVCQVLEMDPDLEEVFLQYDMNCGECSAGERETILEAAEGHDVNVELLLKSLNEVVVQKASAR